MGGDDGLVLTVEVEGDLRLLPGGQRGAGPLLHLRAQGVLWRKVEVRWLHRNLELRKWSNWTGLLPNLFFWQCCNFPWPSIWCHQALAVNDTPGWGEPRHRNSGVPTGRAFDVNSIGVPTEKIGHAQMAIADQISRIWGTFDGRCDSRKKQHHEVTKI